MSKRVWMLLHEEKPDDGCDCYFGLKDRNGCVDVSRGVWDKSDWFVKDDMYCVGSFGDWPPALLNIDIYWCYASDFSTQEDAEASLWDLLVYSI